MNVRTARRFADRMKVQPAKVELQLGDALEVRTALAQPLGEPRLRAVDLDQVHLLVFFHERFHTYSF